MEIEITHTHSHKQHDSNAHHQPLLYLKTITSKLCVAMEMAVSLGRLLLPKLYSSLWQHNRKTCQSVFKRTKENCLATCLFMLLSFMGYHDSNIGPCVTALGNATLEMHEAQHSSNTGLDVMCFYFPLSKTLNCYTSNQELLISSLLTFKN